MNAEPSFKQKLRVETLFDRGSLKVLVSMIISTLILYALCFKSPECKILIYLVWYLGFIILLLKERTTVEVTSHMLIIQRPVLSPLAINKKDIKSVQIRKNTSSIFRYLMFIVPLILTAYLAYNASTDIINEIHGKTITEGITLFLYEFWIVFLMTVILIGMSARLPYSTLLRVDTKESNFIFYPHDTEALKKIIEEQEPA